VPSLVSFHFDLIRFSSIFFGRPFSLFLAFVLLFVLFERSGSCFSRVCRPALQGSRRLFLTAVGVDSRKQCAVPRLLGPTPQPSGLFPYLFIVSSLAACLCCRRQAVRGIG
jgi:hypothetical protein